MVRAVVFLNSMKKVAAATGKLVVPFFQAIALFFKKTTNAHLNY